MESYSCSGTTVFTALLHLLLYDIEVFLQHSTFTVVNDGPFNHATSQHMRKNLIYKSYVILIAKLLYITPEQPSFRAGLQLTGEVISAVNE